MPFLAGHKFVTSLCKLLISFTTDHDLRINMTTLTVEMSSLDQQDQFSSDQLETT